MSRVGYQRGLSSRELASAREFQQFVEDEAHAKRESEDRAEYQRFVDSLNEPMTPGGYRVESLPFEEWRKHMPESDDPAFRGVAATNAALSSRSWRKSQTVVKDGYLSQDELRSLGFDLTVRLTEDGAFANGQKLDIADQVLKEDIDEVTSHFVKDTPDFNRQESPKPLMEFLERNCLYPNRQNLEQAAWLLETVGLIEPKKPEVSKPDSTQNLDPKLNQYGVNLNIDRTKSDELVEGFDPETGQPKKFLPYEVERMDSETYRKTFRLRPAFTRGYFGDRTQ